MSLFLIKYTVSPSTSVDTSFISHCLSATSYSPNAVVLVFWLVCHQYVFDCLRFLSSLFVLIYILLVRSLSLASVIVAPHVSLLTSIHTNHSYHFEYNRSIFSIISSGQPLLYREASNDISVSLTLILE